MGSSKGKVENIERPQSEQELALLDTQNKMIERGIITTEEQEARSAEQHKIWKDNYLPMEVTMGGVDAGGGQAQRQMLDNQMPRYAEDTSGVMGQQAQAQGGKGSPPVSTTSSRPSSKGGR